jgi:hypothetical protein
MGDLVNLNELKAVIEEARVSAGAAADEVAKYARERGRHLAAILASGEPGFPEALKAERDNVALKAGISLAQESDKFALGAVQAILSFLARVLV